MGTSDKAKVKNRAYLLKGDDDFRKLKDLDKLLSELVSPDFSDFDMEEMEGDSTNADRIISGLNVPPFGGFKRVVLVRYANKLSDDEQEKLAKKIDKIPESGCLVLVNPASEKVDGKAKKGSEVIGTLSRALRKIGEVREYGNETSKEKSANARGFAVQLFKDANVKIDPGALALFLQRVGNDFSLINSEAIKLINYTLENKSPISSQDVAAVTSETPEEKVFKLVEAVGDRNQAMSLAYMDEIFDAGNDPSAEAPKTLAMLARQFRLIWQAKILDEYKVRNFSKDSVLPEVLDMLPKDNNILDLLQRQRWLSDRLFRQSRLYSQRSLEKCFELIKNADLALKGMSKGSDDPIMTMQVLVVELARVSN